MFYKNVQCLALESFPFPYLQEQPVLPGGFSAWLGQSHRVCVVVVWLKVFSFSFGITGSTPYAHPTQVPFELNISVWTIPFTIIFLNAI